MAENAKSFFERLTGGAAEQEEQVIKTSAKARTDVEEKEEKQEWLEGEEEGQLTVDMYQNPSEIIIKAMVAGVRPDDLDVSITQDMITVRGRRHKSKEVSEDDYYYKELYWGSFSRSILLPQEIDPERSDATLKNGLLIVHLPKINKEKVQKVKIKSE